MSTRRASTTPKQLKGRPAVIMCEGSDETSFLGRLIRARGLDAGKFDIIEAGGKNAIASTLSVIRKDPQWDHVTRLAILRDADGDANGALQSVGDTLKSAFGFAPGSALVWTNGPPPSTAGTASPPVAHGLSLAIALVGATDTDGPLEGALETLCLSAIPAQHADALSCADALARCAAPLNQWLDPQGRVFAAARSAHDKARFQAYLAARGLSGRLGLALTNTDDLIDFRHTAFDPLTTLLEVAVAIPTAS